MLTSLQKMFLQDQIRAFSRTGCSFYMVEIIEIIIEQEESILDLLELSRKELRHHRDRNHMVAVMYWMSVLNSLSMLAMFMPTVYDEQG